MSRHKKKSLWPISGTTPKTSKEKLCSKTQTQQDKQPPKETTGRIAALLPKIAKKVVEIFLIGISWLSLQQFIVAEPEIRPLDFGSGDPLHFMFVIHNPLYITMYSTQVAMQPGAMRYSSEPQDPSQELKSSPCKKLRSYENLLTESKTKLLMSAQEFGNIQPGHDVTFSTKTSTSGGFRVVVGVAAFYQVQIWGTIPLWSRFVCREFQTTRDSDGRAHIVPYP